MIKEYCKEYLQSLVEIEKDCFTHYWGERDLSESLSSGGVNAYVYEINGSVIGYVLFRNVLDESEILRLGVKKDYRRKGYAENLVKYYFSEIKKQGVEKVFLEVRKSNSGAIELYKKLGFKEIYVREKYYENTEDAVIMTVSLE